jgi:hypothetical protein
MTSKCHGISTPPLPSPPFTTQPLYRNSYPITMTSHNFRRVRHLERPLLFVIPMIPAYFSCSFPVFPAVTSPLHVEALLHLLLVLQLRTSTELH